MEKKNYCEHCNTEIKSKKRFCSKNCIVKAFYSRKENEGKNSKYAMNSFRKKIFGMNQKEYELFTSVCSIEGCNWRWGINIHHIDGNKKNKSKDNFIALCSNHHMLIHRSKVKIEDLKNYKA